VGMPTYGVPHVASKRENLGGDNGDGDGGGGGGNGAFVGGYGGSEGSDGGGGSNGGDGGDNGGNRGEGGRGDGDRATMCKLTRPPTSPLIFPSSRRAVGSGVGDGVGDGDGCGGITAPHVTRLPWRKLSAEPS